MSAKQIQQQLRDHMKVAEAMEPLVPTIADAVELVTDTFRKGGAVLLAGNGGSAADAQHWAAEWVIRLSHSMQRPGMPAIALTTDTSVLTAGGNDIGYDNIFARQINALGKPGDLLIVISTSGNSANLRLAAEEAQTREMKVLGVLGGTGGGVKGLCDVAVVVPSSDTQRIQEMHSFIGHQLCALSEEALYGNR